MIFFHFSRSPTEKKNLQFLKKEKEKTEIIYIYIYNNKKKSQEETRHLVLEMKLEES